VDGRARDAPLKRGALQDQQPTDRCLIGRLASASSPMKEKIDSAVLAALFVDLDELVGHTVTDAEWLAAALCARSPAHREAARRLLARHLPSRASNG